jgi:hypothetical protein
MFDILRLFYDITLFKKAPQDVPFSPLLTRFTLIAYAVISFLMLFMSTRWFSALLQMAADVIFLMIFIRVSLAWVHKSERFQQTFCALMGTDALITLYAIPATAVMFIPNGPLGMLAFLVIVGLMLWHWAVIAHILSHALAQNLGFSLGLALLYVMSAYMLSSLLFSPAASGVAH